MTSAQHERSIHLATAPRRSSRSRANSSDPNVVRNRQLMLSCKGITLQDALTASELESLLSEATLEARDAEKAGRRPEAELLAYINSWGGCQFLLALNYIVALTVSV